MWKNFVSAREATDNIIRRMCFACHISKATDTHSEYVILIAFTLQQWLRDCSCMLHYTYEYIACIVLAFDATSQGNRILTFRRNGLHLSGAVHSINKQISKCRNQVISRRNVLSQNDVIPSCTAAKISRPAQCVSALVEGL